MIRCFRAALILICGATSVVYAAQRPANAADVPTAVCSDGNYFDGLDTRYGASYCADALNAAGYDTAALSNTNAQPVLQSEGTDAVFYHAGHSYVAGSGNTATAISFLYAGAGPEDTMEGLLGDPTAFARNNPIEGPTYLCANGVCRSVTFLTAPYVTEMQKFQLALFQSCNSAQDGVQNYDSPAFMAYYYGNVGTVIGFHDEVYWDNVPGDNATGDGFAHRFWSDAKAGSDYLTSLVDAANAGGGSQYGYGSYVYLHQTGAPTTLRPASYYVP
jgi:hypothetical protein